MQAMAASHPCSRCRHGVASSKSSLESLLLRIFQVLDSSRTVRRMWRVSYVKDLNASWLQCIPQNGLVIVMYLYPQRNLFVQTDCALRKLHHANPFMCHGPASS